MDLRLDYCLCKIYGMTSKLSFNQFQKYLALYTCSLLFSYRLSLGYGSWDCQ